MGFYKDFKGKIGMIVNNCLKEWITRTEGKEGNKVWDSYKGPMDAAYDFSKELKEAIEEELAAIDEETKKKKQFEVKYNKEGFSVPVSKKVFECPTAQHARVLFNRELPGNTILDIKEVVKED